MNKNKHNKYTVLKTLIFIGVICTALTCLIKINIINTKALSPLGNTNDNYELVSEEFGEDFSNFIQDKSPIKIYVKEGEETMVRLGDKDFIIKSTSSLVDYIKNTFTNLKDLLNFK